MDACAIIVFSPILRERNLCRSKQYILLLLFWSSSLQVVLSTLYMESLVQDVF